MKRMSNSAAFAEAVTQGCGPDCGTDAATGAGCGSCATGCAVASLLHAASLAAVASVQLPRRRA